MITTATQAELISGDCIQALGNMSDVDMIFADPPFNIGQAYEGYDDRRPESDFQEFMADWISAACDALRPGGTLVCHVPDALVFKTEALATDADFERVGWIIWHFRFGQATRANFIKSKAHGLCYIKPPHELRAWNPHAVMEPSDRASQYNDPRTLQSETPGERVFFDVWYGPNLGRIQGNNTERVSDRPNQLPERYVARFVRAFSDPDDLVVDPFVGSGTTAVVATKLERRFIGIDIDSNAILATEHRLQRGAVRSCLD